MKHTISALVKNRPRVLTRVAGLFARRGFNIESLTVSTTQDESISRITIVVGEDDATLAQIDGRNRNHCSSRKLASRRAPTAADRSG